MAGKATVPRSLTGNGDRAGVPTVTGNTFGGSRSGDCGFTCTAVKTGTAEEALLCPPPLINTREGA